MGHRWMVRSTRESSLVSLWITLWSNLAMETYHFAKGLRLKKLHRYRRLPLARFAKYPKPHHFHEPIKQTLQPCGPCAETTTSTADTTAASRRHNGDIRGLLGLAGLADGKVLGAHRGRRQLATLPFLDAAQVVRLITFQANQSRVG